jgi:hypothetical protein
LSHGSQWPALRHFQVGSALLLDPRWRRKCLVLSNC